MLGVGDRGLLSKPRMAEGCSLCFSGLKAVIFVTGLCDDHCYYCPVSRERLGRDVFYVNEAAVSTIEEAVAEVARSGARGASLTGGDPLARYGRTVAVVEALKENFGWRFHVHLYTSGRYATREALVELDRAGLDEVRFHPTLEALVDRVSLAKRYTRMDVGVEIPVAPHLVEWAKKVMLEADKGGVDFINLNEMEFVAPNAAALLERGIRESERRPFTVECAYKAGVALVEWAEENVRAPVHFCPASFKDAIQTRNRLVRTALIDRRWDEEVTRGGTVVFKRPTEGGGCELVEAYPTLERTPVVSSTPTQCE